MQAPPAPPVPLTPPAPTVLSAPSVSSVTNESAQEAKTGGKSSPSSSMNKREKKMTSSLQPSGEKVIGKEGSPVDKLSRLQHEVFTLTEGLKSQKELVRLLHKALEAAQQEKRTSKQFLAAAGEQERLELVRRTIRLTYNKTDMTYNKTDITFYIFTNNGFI
ncbi:TBC1 domain family member 2A-like isoform X3 [Acipenser ruthenus]|uniref:TBC1 domain family member 2A-like isoform X3 n=1 Tax=Acipenser ruthenus TaxID=7906 RepID=UPI0027412FA4|nr:TBC1 domain family member 2A-like isoform X3 [Acipenser ruthenus]